jgi:hypothetical protein
MTWKSKINAAARRAPVTRLSTDKVRSGPVSVVNTRANWDRNCGLIRRAVGMRARRNVKFADPET